MKYITQNSKINIDKFFVLYQHSHVSKSLLFFRIINSKDIHFFKRLYSSLDLFDNYTYIILKDSTDHVHKRLLKNINLLGEIFELSDMEAKLLLMEDI